MCEDEILRQKTLDNLLELDTSGHFLHEMVKVFYQDMERNLSHAQDAVEQGNGKAFRKACHAIKNAADCIGAMQLRQHAHQLMTMNGLSGKQALQAQLDLLQTHYQRAREALREFMPKR